MKPFRSFTLLVAAILVASVAANAQTTSATSFVQTSNATLIEIAKQTPPPTDMMKKYRAAFDFSSMAQYSIGSYWAGMTPATRSEFLELFERVLIGNIKNQYTRVADMNLTYLTETTASGSTVVSWKATPKAGGDPVEFETLVESSKGDWRITDLKTNGVSLREGYRSQFAKIRQVSGHEGVIQNLKRKLGIL